MPAMTQPTTLQSVLKWEQENRYSREKITIASGQSVILGQVLSKLTATGEYVALDLTVKDPVDGSETAAAISFDDYDASSSAVPGVAIIRDAIINPAGLIWPEGATDEDKAAALTTLNAAGLIFRSES